MFIFLKHLGLILNILIWEDCKTFTKIVISRTPSRSSHRRCSVKKIFIKIYKISWENTCVGVVFFKNFIKKRLQHRCFPMKFAKFFRISILKNICERQLLLFLRFTKLNHNVFLWLLWRHRFLYNNNKYSKLVLPLLTSEKFRIKTAFKHLNFGCLGYPAPGPNRILTSLNWT